MSIDGLDDHRPKSERRLQVLDAIASSAARPFKTKLSLISRALNGWETLLWCAAALIAALIVPLRYDIGQNSDGLLQTLMSLEHLTLFYWGQDRFANLVPWLASFVRDPTTNAECQLAVRVGMGIASPLLFCVPYANGTDRARAGRATVLASVLALAFMPQRFVHELFIEASPYGTSFALSGLAVLLFSAAGSRGSRFGLTLRTAGLVLTVAAYAVNASLVLVTAPMFALLVLFSSSMVAIDFSIASIVAVILTAIASAATHVPHTSTRFAETMIGLFYYLGQMAGKTGAFLLAMFVLFVIATLIGSPPKSASTTTKNLTLIGYGLILLATAITAFLGVSLSSWVVLNYLHPRYLVPLFCVMSALGALSVTHVIDRVSANPTVARRVGLVLCLLILGYAGRRGLAPIPGENGIVSNSVRASAEQIADTVTELRSDAVAGDYWLVWPSVFLADQQARNLDRAPGHIFGISSRGEARAQALTTTLRRQRQLKILCVDLPNQNCLDLTASTIGIPLSLSSSSPVHRQFAQAVSIDLITLTPRPSGTDPFSAPAPF